MKFKNILPVFLLLISLSFYAQGKKMLEKKEQIFALKVAFITTKLSLTANEAEKFWPVYNAFEDKQFELKHEKSTAYLKKIDDETLNKMSDKEANSLLAQMESTDEELFQLRKKLVYNLKGIISPIKIIKLRKAEEAFNKKLLQQYRDKGRRD